MAEPQKAQPVDPWEDAAKNFQASPQPAGEPSSGADDWKVWQHGAGSEGGEPRTGLEHESYQPIQKFGDVGTDAAIAARNVGRGMVQMPYNIGSALMSPGQTLKSMFTTPEGLANALTAGTYGMAKDVKEGKGAELLGQTIAGMGLTRGAGALGDLALPYRSPVIPTAEANAENLVKAILPPEGVTPGNVKAVMKEAPAIREYAGRTGNALKTIPEGMKAAEGVANEGLQHYRTNFLEPNANVPTSLENGVSPTLGGQTTLGQIEKRISDINDMTRGALRTAKSGGAEMTAMERQGLEQEQGALRQKLYQGLSEKTGVSPEDIQSMREGYGGQYAVKNALESGHYARLTRGGMESQGGSLPTSKTGLLEQVFRRGPFSQEAIANRQFAKRINAFDPSAPFRPTPNPPQATPFQGAPVGDELARQLNATGTPENAGVFRNPEPAPRPTQGPMAKAPAVQEAERVAKAFQDEQAQAFREKKKQQQFSGQQ